MADVWPVVADRFQAALRGDASQLSTEERVLLNRQIPQQEYFLRLAYRPVYDSLGSVLGVWADVSEVRHQVLAECRL